MKMIAVITAMIGVLAMLFGGFLIGVAIVVVSLILWVAARGVGELRKMNAPKDEARVIWSWRRPPSGKPPQAP